MLTPRGETSPLLQHARDATLGAPHSSVIAGAWAFVGVIASYAMLIGLGFGVLPFAGLPIPGAVKGVEEGRPLHVAFLADALLFAAAYVWWRRRRLARQ